MKLVTFDVPTPIGPVQRIGMLYQERILDLNRGYTCYLQEKYGKNRAYELASTQLPNRMIDFFRTGREGREAAERTIEYVDHLNKKGPIWGPQGENILYEIDNVKLKAPVPRPHSIRDYSSFEVHVAFFTKTPPEAWFQMPTCYKGNPDTVIGPEETILWPSFTERLDYELEYGFYIGKEGINIPRDRAEEYIAGYTIFNDITARDILRLEMSCHLGPYKGKDTCNIMGPCLVTPDEVNPQDMLMVARINGEIWSEGNSGTSYWTAAQIIEFASMDETLYPGDFLGFGTVGKGCGIELDKWIQPGDVIELEVEGIGILRNHVGEKPPIRRSWRRH
jgi:2-keto-4-pentenoate hydratase/2-oxohepta-3-ene-1,7-dioic acid hydratase in catechol pathway